MKNAKIIENCIQACADWGLLPTAFRQCMTWEEQVLWLARFLQETVIPTVNENTEAFNELKDYVENFFDNLDVQEEINNKLDEMAESGELEEIIATYLQANVTWTFDTVADMKQAGNLTANSYARTLGFYSVNDGGGATYKITDTGTANELDVIAVGDLYATVVLQDTMNLTQLGVDHTLADTTAQLTNAFTLCSQNKVHLIIPAHTYNITTISSRDASGYHYKYFFEALANLNISGVNREASIIKVNTNANYTGVFFNNLTTENISIDNFTIEQYYTDGNNVDAGDRSNRKFAFVLYGTSDNISIKNIFFKNCCGVNAVGFFNNTISNVTLADCYFDYRIVQGIAFYDRTVVYMECHDYIVENNKVHGNFECLSGIECHGYNGICVNNVVTKCLQAIHVQPRYDSQINGANIRVTGNILDQCPRGIKIWQNSIGATNPGTSNVIIDSNTMTMDGSLYAQQWFLSGGLATTNEINGITTNFATSDKVFKNILISNNIITLKNYGDYTSYTTTNNSFCGGISLSGQHDVENVSIANNYIEGMAGQGISIGEFRASADEYHTIYNVNIIGNTIMNCGYGLQNVEDYHSPILLRYGIMSNVNVRDNIISKTDTSYVQTTCIANEGNATTVKKNVYFIGNVLAPANSSDTFAVKNTVGYPTLITDRGTTANRPTTANKGDIYFDTGLGKIIVYNGSSWKNADGTAL